MADKLKLFLVHRTEMTSSFDGSLYQAVDANAVWAHLARSGKMTMSECTQRYHVAEAKPEVIK